ncbi:Hypothetical protein ACI5QM_02640 [Bacillus subtilis]
MIPVYVLWLLNKKFLGKYIQNPYIWIWVYFLNFLFFAYPLY